jgi:iron(III) transport system permease protein
MHPSRPYFRFPRQTVRGTISNLVGSGLFLGMLGIPIIAAILLPWGTSVMDGAGEMVSMLSASAGASRSAMGEAALNSLLAGVLSVFGAALVGVPLAFLLSVQRVAGRRMARGLALVPLAMPPLVGAVSFFFLFTESGVVPRLIHLLPGLTNVEIRIEGMIAIVAIHAHAFAVFFFTFVEDALSSVEQGEVDAARSLGAGGWRIVVRVLLPHTVPALRRAAVVVFVASLASFSAPLLFGGGMRFLTTEIYAAKVNGEPARAAANAVLLTLASLVVVPIARARSLSGRGAGRTMKLNVAPRIRRFLSVAVWGIVAALLIPPVMLLVLSLHREGSWTTQILPTAYGFESFRMLCSGGSPFRSLGTSIFLAIGATALTMLVAWGVAHVRSRGSSRTIGSIVETTAILPLALPGTVLGVGLLSIYSVPQWFTGGRVFAGTAVIMLMAYLARCLPVATQALLAGYDGVPRATEEAAAIHGARPFVVWLRVTAPMLRTAALSAAAVSFVTAFGEFPASTLLFTPRVRPASIEMLQQLRLFDLGMAGALGVVMLIIALGVSAFVRNRRHGVAG